MNLQKSSLRIEKEIQKLATLWTNSWCALGRTLTTVEDEDNLYTQVLIWIVQWTKITAIVQCTRPWLVSLNKLIFKRSCFKVLWPCWFSIVLIGSGRTLPVWVARTSCRSHLLLLFLHWLVDLSTYSTFAWVPLYNIYKLLSI